jgi:hypothetical protein
MQGQYFTPDIPLTNVSQAFYNDPSQWIADLLAPTVMVPKKTFNIWFYGKDTLKQALDDTRTRFGKTKIVNGSITSKAFGPLRGHELMDGIDFDQDEMAETPLDFEIDITNYLSEKLAITKELSVHTLLTNASTITNNVTLSGASQWSNYSSSTPLDDIRLGFDTQRLYGLKPANTIAFSYQTFSWLSRHPQLIEMVKYAGVVQLTEEQMLGLLKPYGVSRILVSSATYDSAAEGLTASNSYIWGGDVLIGYVTPTPGLRTVNGAYTFTLENGRYVDSWFEQGRKTKWIRNNDYYVPQVVGSEAWYLIKNAISTASL